jgi:MoaA/NifB/PqqE/SkfB family radical SAM enzyme
MVNYASVHAKEKKTVDYIIDSVCSKIANPCKMCYVKAMKHAGKKIVKDTQTIVSDLSTLNQQGYSTFIVTRDLLTRNDWKEIVKAAKEEHILTTGQPIVDNPSILEDMVESGIKQVVMSANLEDVAKKLNLPDAETTKKAVGMVKSKGISAMLTMMVNKDNYKKVYEMVDYAVSLGADNLRFLQYIPLFGDHDSALNKQEMKFFLESSYELQESGKYPESTIYISREGNFSGPYHKKGCTCDAVSEHLLIGLDNLIYPCLFFVNPKFVIGKFLDGQIIIDEDKKGKLPFKDSMYCKSWEYHTSSGAKK